MSQLIKAILLLLLTLNTGNLYAKLQGQAKIDSLLKELPKQKEDTNKVNLLNELSAVNYSINPDEGIKYGQTAISLATKLDWKKGMAKANNNMGNNYCFGKSDNTKALEHYLKSIKLYEETEDKQGIAAITCNIGIVYKIQGDYPKAMEYFLKALTLDEALGLKNYAANVAVNIGVIYKVQGNYQKALEYYLKSLTQYESLGNKKGITDVTANIGIIYEANNDYPKALEYMLKASQLYEEMGDKYGFAVNKGNIGDVYKNQKNYTMAIEYFEHSLKVAEEIGDNSLIAFNLSSIGSLYLSIISDTAASKTVKANELHEPNTGKYKSDKTIPTSKPAMLLAAIEHFSKSLAIAKEINEPETIQYCYEGLAKAYRLKGDYQKALDAADNYTAIKDSLFSKENNEKIVRLEMEKEYDKKAAESQKTAALKLQQQQNYTYMGIAGIILLAGFSFFIVKERGKSERQRKIAETERKKSDDLLLNILPTEIANELKANGSTTAKHYDNVTVLFTDFVNFTNAGERMSPQGLIDELHTCFKAFDEITAKYSIEKIKTIGDAYLAVAGLPTADPKHAENIVRAATEINIFMADRRAKLGERTFEVRIGIHSGNVVAGIVGVKKFAYDIWGDTVNTAARMEQNSETGKINISQTTYELVKDKIDCEYRGEVEAKGKGAMKMYYVS